MIRLALLLAPLAVAGAEPVPVIRVDAVAITAEAITRRAESLRAEGRKFKPEELVEALVDEAALAVEARRTGLDKDPGVRAVVEQGAAKALAEYFASERLADAIVPTEAELQKLYHDGSDLVRLEMVAVATEAEAAQVLKRLETGGELALEVARSLDIRSRSKKGDTGLLNKIQLAPTLVKPAFEAPIGKLFGPVPLREGFAVARVVERKLADPAGFAARRPSLEQFAKRQGLSVVRKHYAEQQRAKHAAKVDEAFIASLGRRTDVTPAELEKPFAVIDGKPIPYRALHPRVLSFGAGHLAGSATKVQLAWTAVDERLLADAARAAGVAGDPGARIDVAAAEHQALATAAADRIAASQPKKASASERAAAVRRRIKALRGELAVSVDRKAAVAAAGASR